MPPLRTSLGPAFVGTTVDERWFLFGFTLGTDHPWVAAFAGMTMWGARGLPLLGGLPPSPARPWFPAFAGVTVGFKTRRYAVAVAGLGGMGTSSSWVRGIRPLSLALGNRLRMISVNWGRTFLLRHLSR